VKYASKRVKKKGVLDPRRNNRNQRELKELFEKNQRNYMMPYILSTREKTLARKRLDGGWEVSKCLLFVCRGANYQSIAIRFNVS
jgi:hypothetical protein